MKPPRNSLLCFKTWVTTWVRDGARCKAKVYSEKPSMLTTTDEYSISRIIFIFWNKKCYSAISKPVIFVKFVESITPPLKWFSALVEDRAKRSCRQVEIIQEQQSWMILDLVSGGRWVNRARSRTIFEGAPKKAALSIRFDRKLSRNTPPSTK